MRKLLSNHAPDLIPDTGIEDALVSAANVTDGPKVVFNFPRLQRQDLLVQLRKSKNSQTPALSQNLRNWLPQI